MTVALRAWLILTAITLGLAGLLALGGDHIAPRAWLALIAVASFAKARLILFDYLNLRGVNGWRGGFIFGLLALIVLVYALLAVRPGP